MSNSRKQESRRTFLKTVGAACAGSMFVSIPVQAKDSSQPETVPRRPFGQTGVDVSILSLGGVLKMSDQLVFRQALKQGVTYWDTADGYGWGENEKAIGKYFAKAPQDRSKVFLVTKAATSDPKKLTEKLNTSLERMNTSYVDMYFIHYVSDVKAELPPGGQGLGGECQGPG